MLHPSAWGKPLLRGWRLREQEETIPGRHTGLCQVVGDYYHSMEEKVAWRWVHIEQWILHHNRRAEREAVRAARLDFQALD